jgi:hypothetical protein
VLEPEYREQQVARDRRRPGADHEEILVATRSMSIDDPDGEPEDVGPWFGQPRAPRQPDDAPVSGRPVEYLGAVMPTGDREVRVEQDSVGVEDTCSSDCRCGTEDGGAHHSGGAVNQPGCTPHWLQRGR